jgi:hypothetical protein
MKCGSDPLPSVTARMGLQQLIADMGRRSAAAAAYRPTLRARAFGDDGLCTNLHPVDQAIILFVEIAANGHKVNAWPIFSSAIPAVIASGHSGSDTNWKSSATNHASTTGKSQEEATLWPGWDAQHDTAAHVLCVISENYLNAPYSSWERHAAQWAAATDRPNFTAGLGTTLQGADAASTVQALRPA